MVGSFRLTDNRGKAIIVAIVIFCVMMVVPVMLMGVYYQTNNSLTTQKEAEQQTLVDLASLALKLKVDSLVGIASSYATSPQLITDVQAKKWSDAGLVIRDLGNNGNFYDPFIDRVVVYDAVANQQAAYPALTGGVGNNFSSSSWYQAMQATGATSFVSGATKRKTVPQIQVINIVVAIADASTTIGYVDLQVPTDNFLEFGENLSLGTYGFAYVVDSSGNIIAHPKYFSDENTQVINYSSVPAVAAVIAGKSGTAVVNDPISNGSGLVAYKPVPEYGWGIITQEPYNEIFYARDGILWGIALLIASVCVINILVAYMIFRVIAEADERKKRHAKK
jgi:hypothetical protein